MKKVFYFLALACFLANFAFSQTQVTVTFKPDATIGNDATIWMLDDSCIFNGQQYTPAILNYGNSQGLVAADWTWNANGCNGGTIRSLLKFDELSSIPNNATIINAELKLFGVPNHIGWITTGNYGSNQSYLKRITSPWQENTVTWFNQPNTTNVNQITISQSSSQWNWNFTDNSTNLLTIVQDWVSNPSSNYGIMMQLATEIHYRCLIFASSDHPNASLWPELTITYETITPCDCIDTIIQHDTVVVPPPPCPCEANFSYTANSTKSNEYFFIASNPAASHRWIVDGTTVSSANFLNYTFTIGNHKVCYIRTTNSGIKCESCIEFCIKKTAISKDNTASDSKENSNILIEEKSLTDKKAVQETIVPGDIIPEEKSFFYVYPNPSNDEITVEMLSNVSEQVEISVVDVTGKIVLKEQKDITDGENSFKLNINKLINGSYIVQIKGEKTNLNKAVIKK